ncbi:MAG TPA: GntR family transcriptional regulator [Ktedonobacteraceae bacterium]|nr:GntR family transcriptional regulator [Ktedonobacteraceae bacterium]
MHDTPDPFPLQAEVLNREAARENGVVPLYTRLRTMILDGVFPPGSMLSQVKLAESLGVSRIPLREALRMLQKEGLIEAEHNQRARVPSFEPSIVDSLYASRILLEALSIRLTVPHIDQADVQALKQTLTELDEAAAHIDLDAWEEPHRRFHALLVRHAEDSLRQRIASYANQCEYYRRLYYRLVSTHQPTRPAEVIAAEHHSIANACTQGNADLAAYLLTRHYARTALTVLGQMTPEFNPEAVRMALQIVGADAPLPEAPPPRRQTRSGQEAQANVKRSQSV